MPGAGGTIRLPIFAGKSKAMEIALSGEPFSASEALRIGVASKVVPLEKLAEETLKLANSIAKNSLVGLRIIKESVNSSFESPLEEGIKSENRLFRLLFQSEDSKEGISAFVQKRKPVWKNK